jgi:Tol biopolymer transport system component
MLLLGIGCGDQNPSAPRTGSLKIVATLHGNGTDANGFVVTIAGRSTVLTPGAPITVTDLPVGSDTVQLSDIAPQCWSDADSVIVRIDATSGASASFNITCIGGIAYSVQVNPGRATHIEYVDESGSVRALTGDETAEWSPDGTHILFTRGGIFAVALDSTVQPLTTSAGDALAHYSPDGSKIVFQREDDGAFFTTRVHVMNADGTDVHEVFDSAGTTFLPAWARGGTDVVFECNTFDVCAVHPDGTTFRDNPTSIATRGLVTSPDGDIVAVEGNSGVFAMRITDDGTTDTLTLINSLSAANFAWAPSSDRLVIETVTSSDFTTDLQVVNLDGSGLTMLADSTNFQFFDPSWSPDGAWIAFAANEADTAQQILVMRPDGTDKHRITADKNFKLAPIWNPLAKPGTNSNIGSRASPLTVSYFDMSRAKR